VEEDGEIRDINNRNVQKDAREGIIFDADEYNQSGAYLEIAKPK
jgi:hypothetical protein